MKILKRLSLLGLGLMLSISLFSCSGKQTVTITDENGKEIEVELQKSSDPEVIYNAVSYASSPSFDDVNTLKLSSKLEFELRLNDQNNLKGSLESALEVDKDENAYIKLFLSDKGKIDNEENKDKLNVEVYNVNDTNLYIDYELESISTSESKKIKINEDTIKGLINSFLPKLPELPAIPNLTALEDDNSDKNEMLEDYEEFIKNYPNSKASLSHVSSKSMTLELKVSLKDILANAYPNKAIEIKNVKDDCMLRLLYKLDTKTARPLSLSLSLDGKNISSFIAILDEGNTLELNKPAIRFNAEFKASYHKESKVKALSDKDKEAYKQFSF